MTASAIAYAHHGTPNINIFGLPILINPAQQQHHNLHQQQDNVISSPIHTNPNLTLSIPTNLPTTYPIINPKLKYIQYIELKRFNNNIHNHNDTNTGEIIYLNWGNQLTIIFEFLLNLKGIIYDGGYNNDGTGAGFPDLVSSIVRNAVMNKRNVWTHLNLGTVNLGEGQNGGGNGMQWCLDFISTGFHHVEWNSPPSAWVNLRVLKLDLSKTPTDIIHDFESLSYLGNVTTMMIDMVMGFGSYVGRLENGRNNSTSGMLYNLLVNIPMGLKKLKLGVDADEIFALTRSWGGGGTGGTGDASPKLNDVKRLLKAEVLQLYIGSKRVMNGFKSFNEHVDTYPDIAFISGLRILFGWFFPHLQKLWFSLDRFDSPRFIGVYESSTSRYGITSTLPSAFADMVSSTLLKWTLVPSNTAFNLINPITQFQQQRSRVHPLLNPSFYTNLTHLHLRSGQSALSHLNPSTAPFWQRLDSLTLDDPGTECCNSDIYTYVDELIDMLNVACNVRYLGFVMGLASKEVDGYRKLLKGLNASCERLRWVRLFDRKEPVRLGHVGMVGGNIIPTGVVDVMLELVCWVSGVRWLHCDWIGTRVDGNNGRNADEATMNGRTNYLKWEMIAEQLGILVLGVVECRYDPFERVEYPRRVLDV
ncbi:hypothetical protein HDU76_000802 [Blyttiomyces sp. JEL0837]|nr:hypothetical protein HDU76_000802 [Blyttiomyces sp. JEL0837]